MNIDSAFYADCPKKRQPAKPLPKVVRSLCLDHAADPNDARGSCVHLPPFDGVIELIPVLSPLVTGILSSEAEKESWVIQ